MSSAFNIAINTLFSDCNLGQIATYVPMQGESKKVSVIMHKPDAFPSIGNSFVATPTLLLDVRVTDCPTVSAGDKFLVDGAAHSVQGQPRRDDVNLVWRVDLYEIDSGNSG